MKNYKKYLKSGKWRYKRKQVFKSYGKRCFYCGRLTSLDVHHKTYKRIFREKIKDLRPSCRRCHNARSRSK